MQLCWILIIQNNTSDVNKRKKTPVSPQIMFDTVFKLSYLPSLDTVFIAVLSISLISGLFLVQGYVGFSLWDEGYLWYGVQRVMLGEVPIRDFMAYDPGRYYWSAALMSLSGGDGIMALRGAVAVFQAIGLFIGLKLISDTVKKQNFIYLLLSSITLLVWMYPRHKLFDISLSIFLIGILTFLIKRPTPKRYFYTGLCVGLIAIFGRNHGIYGVVSVFCIVAWSSINQVDWISIGKSLTHFFAGITVGFLPIIFMLILVPGFGVAFIDSVLFLFELKSTNLSLPIPWPWLVHFSDVPVGNAIRSVLIGSLFIALIIFGVLSIAWITWQKFHNKQVNPAFAAASFLVLPYAHFAYSRADVSHLAQAVFPLMIGSLVFLSTRSTKVKWSGVLMLCLTSLWVMHNYHPGWQCYARMKCVDVGISDSNLLVDRGTVADINLLRKLAEVYASNNKSFVVTPFWPGAYPLLQRKSPVWETFALFPRSQPFENAEIERIKAAKPGFILIYDRSLDGRDVLRFRNTHPFTYQYILNSFNLLPDSPNSAYQIYIAKENI